MITKKLKKTISILGLTAILSGATFSSVSAKGNDAATPNSTQNDIQMRIGGGPSDSAAWTKKRSYYTNFTHDQLATMNKNQSDAVSSNSYNRGKAIYNVSCFIAVALVGHVSEIAGLGTGALLSFSESNYSLIQSTANTINSAYNKGGTQALYVTEYYRPASGEMLYCLSWY